MGNLRCVREHSVFRVVFFFTQFNLGYMGPLRSS